MRKWRSEREGVHETDAERDGAGGDMGLEMLDGEGIEEVPNGLRRVEMWGEGVEIPPVQGFIL